MTNHRVPEAQALLNTAFGAYLLATSVHAATKKAGRPLAWPCIFLVLPFVLPADTRNDLPTQSVHSMSAWLTEHPQHQAAFAERAVVLTEYTRASLRTAVRHRAIDVTSSGLRCPRAPRSASAAASEEVTECARRAGLVGRWLAVVEPALAFTLLGVRP
ncbi:three component ABC system middle component [Saccharopolyspora sp. NPDC050389]|uniref:three component ABC system middle component n=1 Tax=Saccharopolyspora sp. NPDC050389 TaxID=3155516 RepID=UPI0033F8BDE1